MKRTDIQRKERDDRRSQKKMDRIAKAGSREEMSTGDYINKLHSLFYFDENRIYNIANDEQIFELLFALKESVDDKEYATIIRKAVRKCQIKEKEQAVEQLIQLVDD